MTRAKIADLKNNLSRYLAYVREGGEVLVLDRDTPVARLVPLDAAGKGRERPAARDRWAEERLAEMERQGVIKRGNPKAVAAWLNGSRPVRLPRGSGSIVRELLDMRDEDTR